MMKSSFNLFLVFLLLSINPVVHAKTFSFTANARREAMQLLNVETARVKSLPLSRPNSEPIIELHPAGSKVHGSVLVFHGYTGHAGSSGIPTKPLFQAGFNVVTINLAGHAQAPSVWPSTRVRQTRGYQVIRKALLNEPRLASVTKDVDSMEFNFINSTSLLMPIVRDALRKCLTPADYKNAEEILHLLRPFPGVNDASFAKSLDSYFVSEHKKYDWSSRYMVSLMQPLPGPLHVIGYSLGGANTVNAASFGGGVSKAVLLAPYFGDTLDAKSQDANHYIALAGAVDLFKRRLFNVSIPLTTRTTLQLFGRLSARDEITQSVRRSTETLCVLAADDTIAPPERSYEVCSGKLGGRVFIYPRSAGIGHNVPAGFGNPYGQALTEQINNFLLNDTVDEAAMLVKNQQETCSIVSRI